MMHMPSLAVQSSLAWHAKRQQTVLLNRQHILHLLMLTPGVVAVTHPRTMEDAAIAAWFTAAV